VHPSSGKQASSAAKTKRGVLPERRTPRCEGNAVLVACYRDPDAAAEFGFAFAAAAELEPGCRGGREDDAGRLLTVARVQLAARADVEAADRRSRVSNRK
jgi:hypothetical protein